MRNVGPMSLRNIWMGADEAGFEGAAPLPRDARADVAHADDADGLLPHLHPEQLRPLDLRPCADHAVHLTRAPRAPQPERHRHLGSRLAVDARLASDRDAVLLRRLDIDAVVADTLLADDLK